MNYREDLKKMEITQQPLDDCMVVVVDGQLTADAAEEFKRILSQIVSEHKQLVLDLERMNYIDSTGLGALIYLFQLVSDCGGSLKLAALQAKPRIVFEITRAYKILDIYDSVDAARAGRR